MKIAWGNNRILERRKEARDWELCRNKQIKQRLRIREQLSDLQPLSQTDPKSCAKSGLSYATHFLPEINPVQARPVRGGLGFSKILKSAPLQSCWFLKPAVQITMEQISARQEKVRKFEDFIDRRLKPDLIKAIAERDNVFQQQKVYQDLKRNIQTLEKNGVTSLRTMVNLGSEVYMQAEVPDTRHIFVDIGMGFYVEFTWSEALDFIVIKEARLAKQIEEYTHLIATVKSQIKLVCEGIRELLQISAD